MISTPNRANCFATMIFSSTFMLAPGDCSPSRNVVSKIRIMRVMVSPLPPPRADQNGCPARPHAKKTPESYPLGYVEDGFKPRTQLASVFISPKKHKRLPPHAQGRRLEKLRGTTLI